MNTGVGNARPFFFRNLLWSQQILVNEEQAKLKLVAIRQYYAMQFHGISIFS